MLRKLLEVSKGSFQGLERRVRTHKAELRQKGIGEGGLWNEVFVGACSMAWCGETICVAHFCLGHCYSKLRSCDTWSKAICLGPQGHSVVEPRGPSITQTALNRSAVDFTFQEILKDTLMFVDDEEENNSFRNHFCTFCFLILSLDAATASTASSTLLFL